MDVSVVRPHAERVNELNEGMKQQKMNGAVY